MAAVRDEPGKMKFFLGVDITYFSLILVLFKRMPPRIVLQIFFAEPETMPLQEMVRVTYKQRTFRSNTIEDGDTAGPGEMRQPVTQSVNNVTDTAVDKGMLYIICH